MVGIGNIGDDDMVDGKSTAQIIDEANAAIKETEEFLKNSPKSALQIEDLSEMASKYLTDGAKVDLARKAMQLISVNDDGSVFQCIYLAARVKKTNVEKAVEKLASVLNEISAQGLLHSTLAPISSLDLAIMSMQAPSCVVIAYVLVPIAYVKDMQHRYKDVFMQEGELPESMEDLTIPSEEGEFFAHIRTTIMSNMLSAIDGDKAEDLLQKQIDQHLAVLPKGTIVREVKKLAISDLSIPYDIKFYNPLLKRVKKVELNYTRMAEMSNGIFEQFNLFRGITYFDSEGKEI